MKNCKICGKAENEALLCQVLAGNGFVIMCDECAKHEGLPVIRKPSEENAIKYALAQKAKKSISSSLIDNFHWQVMMSRRRTRLSQKQLAQELGVAEQDIADIEKGKEPENPEVIRKIEGFFRINLHKDKNLLGDEIEPV
jgi:ribosome-binding protein aMBF1 (putative translation factor)